VSINEWVAIIALVVTILGLLAGGLIYVVRLEGRANVLHQKAENIEAQVATMSTKVDQILLDLISVLKTLAVGAAASGDSYPYEGVPSARKPQVQPRRTPRLAAGKGRPAPERKKVK
jgi:hypothetical protein